VLAATSLDEEHLCWIDLLSILLLGASDFVGCGYGPWAKRLVLEQKVADGGSLACLNTSKIFQIKIDWYRCILEGGAFGHRTSSKSTNQGLNGPLRLVLTRVNPEQSWTAGALPSLLQE
jgi:hypothetical protein